LQDQVHQLKAIEGGSDENALWMTMDKILEAQTKEVGISESLRRAAELETFRIKVELSKMQTEKNTAEYETKRLEEALDTCKAKVDKLSCQLEAGKISWDIDKHNIEKLEKDLDKETEEVAQLENHRIECKANALATHMELEETCKSRDPLQVPTCTPAENCLRDHPQRPTLRMACGALSICKIRSPLGGTR
jgi:chromosome segregation ATPase